MTERHEEAKVIAVNISEKKGERKHPVPAVTMVVGHGIAGDAHAADWHRQVSLLAQESIDKMQAGLTDIRLQPGDFAENITTSGIEVAKLPVGTKLKVGADVELEVTQIGKECHRGCAIRKQVGDCVMPREGIFTVVVAPGEIKPGDTIMVAGSEK